MTEQKEEVSQLNKKIKLCYIPPSKLFQIKQRLIGNKITIDSSSSNTITHNSIDKRREETSKSRNTINKVDEISKTNFKTFNRNSIQLNRQQTKLTDLLSTSITKLDLSRDKSTKSSKTSLQKIISSIKKPETQKVKINSTSLLSSSTIDISMRRINNIKPPKPTLNSNTVLNINKINKPNNNISSTNSNMITPFNICQSADKYDKSDKERKNSFKIIKRYSAEKNRVNNLKLVKNNSTCKTDSINTYFNLTKNKDKRLYHSANKIKEEQVVNANVSVKLEKSLENILNRTKKLLEYSLSVKK